MDSIIHSSSNSDHSIASESAEAVSSHPTSHRSSSPAGDKLDDSLSSAMASGTQIDVELREFFAESRAGKIWRTATHLLRPDEAIDRFPEWVPSTGAVAGQYIARESKFWTCGFFPGSLYTLLERHIRFPKYFPVGDPHIDRKQVHAQLLQLCRRWSEPLHEMAFRRNTHDVGFIIMPALRLDWELTGNTRSLDSIITAAESLASRFDDRVGAIRSWDQSFSKRYSITDQDENFLVIIDSMCNLDLLFYAGQHTDNQRYIDVAISHAHAVARAIIRPNGSSYHVCNFDPKTGAVQRQYTHQGYKDGSTWSRGQAWGILGFTQTYIWTKDTAFLHAATSLANHFLERLSSAQHHHPYVPLWDFDDTTGAPFLRDTSAGMIAANGMLLLHQILQGSSTTTTVYLNAVLRIAKETVELSLADDPALFTVDGQDGRIDVADTKWAAILKNATANNNEFAILQYSDHGLVYADYYFLEFGNKLLRMGLV